LSTKNKTESGKASRRLTSNLLISAVYIFRSILTSHDSKSDYWFYSFRTVSNLKKSPQVLNVSQNKHFLSHTHNIITLYVIAKS